MQILEELKFCCKKKNGVIQKKLKSGTKEAEKLVMERA